MRQHITIQSAASTMHVTQVLQTFEKFFRE
jgi:hypothetical protein